MLLIKISHRWKSNFRQILSGPTNMKTNDDEKSRITTKQQAQM